MTEQEKCMDDISKNRNILKEIGDLDQKIKSDIKIAIGTGYLGFHQASKKFAERLIQEVYNKLFERSLKQIDYKEDIKGHYWKGIKIYFESWPEFKELSSYVDWKYNNREPILNAVQLALNENGISRYNKNYTIEIDNELCFIWELANFDTKIRPGTSEFFKDSENIEKCIK